MDIIEVKELGGIAKSFTNMGYFDEPSLLWVTDLLTLQQKCEIGAVRLYYIL